MIAIPQLYSSERKCARTGSREILGIFGPREMECRMYYIPRGLNAQELKLVEDSLLKKLPDAKRLLEDTYLKESNKLFEEPLCWCL